MIFFTVLIVWNDAHVIGRTQFGANLQQENVTVILDGKVVIAMKVCLKISSWLRIDKFSLQRLFRCYPIHNRLDYAHGLILLFWFAGEHIKSNALIRHTNDVYEILLTLSSTFHYRKLTLLNKTYE